MAESAGVVRRLQVPRLDGALKGEDVDVGERAFLLLRLCVLPY